MKIIILLILFSICSCVSIEHREGSLPKIKIHGAEDTCTEELKARVRSNQFTITCSIRF